MEIVGGVDTHSAVHCVAAMDTTGRLLGCAEFPAQEHGYRELVSWLRGHGNVQMVGVEGTGAYWAGLARYLLRQGVAVVEVPRPDRRLRRSRGKSDPIDAEAAARAVVSGTATILPKIAEGPIEALRLLWVARQGAVKARTAAANTLRGLLVTAPEGLRGQLPRAGSATALASKCSRLRPRSGDCADPTQAAKLALLSVAGRVAALGDEVRLLDRRIADIVQVAAPQPQQRCSPSAPRQPAPSSSPSATILIVFAAREPSRGSAALLRFLRRRARPTVTGFIAAATVRQTEPFTRS